MTNSRAHGLILIAIGMGTFGGTTNDLLPAVAFFPAMVVCIIGTFVFMKANRAAMEESETATLKRLNPELKNAKGEALANRQAAVNPETLSALDTRDGRVAAQAAQGSQVQSDELVLYEVDAAEETSSAPQSDAAEGDKESDPNFVVTTDVSFPLELQEQRGLADQLTKLKRLADDGIISAEEFAVAKAKLLT